MFKKVATILSIAGLFLFSGVPVFAYDFVGNGWTQTDNIYSIKADSITATINFNTSTTPNHAVNVFCGTDSGVDYTGLNLGVGGAPTGNGVWQDKSTTSSQFDWSAGSHTVTLDCSQLPATGTDGTNNFSTSTFDLSLPGQYVAVQTDFPADYTAISLSSVPTPTPTTGGGGVLGAVTLDPTQAYKVNAAVGSIPNAAAKEVSSIWPIVMPYILVLVMAGVAFWLTFISIKYYASEHH